MDRFSCRLSSIVHLIASIPKLFDIILSQQRDACLLIRWVIIDLQAHPAPLSISDFIKKLIGFFMQPLNWNNNMLQTSDNNYTFVASITRKFCNCLLGFSPAAHPTSIRFIIIFQFNLRNKFFPSSFRPYNLLCSISANAPSARNFYSTHKTTITQHHLK